MSPSVDDGQIDFSAMTLQGWRTGSLDEQNHVRLEQSSVDQLAVASHRGNEWVELDSTIHNLVNISAPDNRVENAERPALSADGGFLAFLREENGRGSLWIRNNATHTETVITAPRLDVYDMAFSANRTILFSAADKGGPIQLFRRQIDGQVIPLGIGNARYPSVSPDERWLAYSALTKGVWHLTVRDLQTGIDRRIGVADCNDFSPAWESDSKTLIYVSDCGRGLWQMAMLRRKVIPVSSPR